MRQPPAARTAVHAPMQPRVQRIFVLGQRPLALDDAGRDIVGDRLDDRGDVD